MFRRIAPLFVIVVGITAAPTDARADTIRINKSGIELYTRGQMACTVASYLSDLDGTGVGASAVYTNFANTQGSFTAEIYDKDGSLAAETTSSAGIVGGYAPGANIYSDPNDASALGLSDGGVVALSKSFLTGYGTAQGRFANGRIVLTFRGTWPEMKLSLFGRSSGEVYSGIVCNGKGVAEITLPFTITQ